MDELIKEMEKCITNEDTEEAHVNADDLLEKALIMIGGNNDKIVKLVQLYDKVGKWYA